MNRLLRAAFILAMAAVGATFAAVGGWWYARASAPVNGPIILISIDALRADHLPAYGYTKVRTPAIDALAANGIVFERAYSNAAQTLPSHASLLSGRLPFETGVRGDAGFLIKPDERLLAQLLRERGYATGGIVSAYVLREETGIAQGFDFFDGDLPPTSPEVDIEQIGRPGSDSETVAEHWLNSIGTSRAFLFLHLYEPHAPHTPPGQFAAFGAYDGEIAAADDAVGRLTQYLKAHQLYDQSTIILVSDHGEGLGDRGEQGHGLFLHEESLHVPLIIKPSGAVGAEQRVKDIVQLADLVPTILDLAKAPIPDSLRGRSLKLLLDGTGHLPERTVYAETYLPQANFGWSTSATLRGDRYRYIRASQEELYDLTRDPRERDSVAATTPQVLELLRNALDRLAPAATRLTPARLSAEQSQRRRALGYADENQPLASRESVPGPKEQRNVLEQLSAADAARGEGRWNQSIALLQQLLDADPEMVDVWRRLGLLATEANRADLAVEAFRHVVELRSSDPQGYLMAAEALLRTGKLDEAQEHAALAASLGGSDARIAGDAHELLARIFLVRRNEDAARREAKLAGDANPALVTPAFVEASLLHDDGMYEEALPLLERAVAHQTARGGRQMPDLRYLAAEAAMRLERYPEAERQYLAELHYFPRNTRASAALATLYRSMGRLEEASQVVSDMTRLVPTTESYTLAGQLWTALGNRQKADVAKTEARRRLADQSRRDRSRTAQQH